MAARVSASSKVPGALQTAASSSWSAKKGASAWVGPTLTAVVYGTKTAESKKTQDGQANGNNGKEND